MPKLTLDPAWCLCIAEGNTSYGEPLRVMQEVTQRKMCSLGPLTRAHPVWVTVWHWLQVEPSLEQAGICARI